ncbi:hypothetical protein BDN72DRAFT_859545 [Pluteus cervinus]|uniref:Uncharacterized protein n=1 Tax=Pluteus cervinus TaxID=181527 RepID=A0ACD3AN17_9AGAR|nr:hypothetical protein BDN72DRAFT_859545 [Pluteus cervinus]
MGFAFRKFVVSIGLLSVLASTTPDVNAGRVSDDAGAHKDPWALGGKTWVAPKDGKACYKSVKVDPKIKSNISHTNYASEDDFHIALSRAVARLTDGHCVWINGCYDSMFMNYVPLPLNLLVDSQGKQDVYIAKEAFSIASAEFGDQISAWQNALPGKFKDSLSGTKVIAINGRPPFDSVNASAAISSSYEGLGTRQNAYFSSYRRTPGGWNYVLGKFAEQGLPLDDQVTSTILRTPPDVVTIHYRFKLGLNSVPSNDAPSWRDRNRATLPDTHGWDYYAPPLSKDPSSVSPVQKFQQQPHLPASKQPHHLDVILDNSPPTDFALPQELTPSLPVLDEDRKTGIMVLGSFADGDYEAFFDNMLDGLTNLKQQNATRLIDDVTNNGGGWTCAAAYLHRIISGPKSTAGPQGVLDTKTRAGPLAKLLVKAPISGIDPGHAIIRCIDEDWLKNTVDLTINGRKDSFSQRLGRECSAYDYLTQPPDEALFDGKKVAIVSNGRCALFQVVMTKCEGSKTVVVGGKHDIAQQYCVGGQSTDLSVIDSEIKTGKPKDRPLAPPDLLINGILGVTWQLAFGVENTQEPEVSPSPFCFSWATFCGFEDPTSKSSLELEGILTNRQCSGRKCTISSQIPSSPLFHASLSLRQLSASKHRQGVFPNPNPTSGLSTLNFAYRHAHHHSHLQPKPHSPANAYPAPIFAISLSPYDFYFRIRNPFTSFSGYFASFGSKSRAGGSLLLESSMAWCFCLLEWRCLVWGSSGLEGRETDHHFEGGNHDQAEGTPNGIFPPFSLRVNKGSLTLISGVGAYVSCGRFEDLQTSGVLIGWATGTRNPTSLLSFVTQLPDVTGASSATGGILIVKTSYSWLKRGVRFKKEKGYAIHAYLNGRPVLGHRILSDQTASASGLSKRQHFPESLVMSTILFSSRMRPVLHRTLVVWGETESWPGRFGPEWFQSNGKYAKNLLWGDDSGPSSLFTVLECCKNLTNLAIWTEVKERDVPSLLASLSQLRLRRLSTDLSNLSIGPFLQNHAQLPMFLNLTHLEDTSRLTRWSFVAGIQYLPRLTHLSLSVDSSTAAIRNALEFCERLIILILFSSFGERRNGSGNITFEVPLRSEVGAIGDSRIVSLESAYLEEWEVGSQGGRDMWALAEEIIGIRALRLDSYFRKMF